MTTTPTLFMPGYGTVYLFIRRMLVHFYPRATLASAGINCRRVSVCPSVCPTVRLSVRLSQVGCFTGTAVYLGSRKQRHTIAQRLVFCCRKSGQNSNRVTPNGGAKCRWGRSNAGEVAENWRLSTRSVVNLAWSPVHHTERPHYLFAARSPWCSVSRGICRRQLILVHLQ